MRRQIKKRISRPIQPVQKQANGNLLFASLLANSPLPSLKTRRPTAAGALSHFQPLTLMHSCENYSASGFKGEEEEEGKEGKEKKKTETQELGH